MGPSFYPDSSDFNTGSKSVFQDTAVAEIFELGSDKSAALARFYMLKLNDRPEIIIEFDAQSVPEISGSRHIYKVLKGISKFFAKILFFPMARKVPSRLSVSSYKLLASSHKT
jgi:hypothetical protein